MAGTADTADNGRDQFGRFATGNKFGGGNPLHRRTCELRTALLKKVTPDDIEQVITHFVELAKSGDAIAARELLDRTVGDAVQSELFRRVESLEKAVLGLQACFATLAPHNSQQNRERFEPNND